MNEKIKELAEQAGIYDFVIEAMGIDLEMQQFAELIVRECMEVCKSRVGNSDYNTGRMHCASDLKQHFGVEE